MKSLIKKCLYPIFAILMSPFSLSYWLLSKVLNPDTLLAGYSQLLALLPGKTGSYARAAFYRFSLTRCSVDAVVSFLVLFSQKDTEIEEGVYIGPKCNIGKCRIGKNTLLGSAVHIMSGKGQHKFDDLDVPIRDQGGFFAKVSIGENCWIGNGALVMANVGEGSVIAAGSVVVNDVPNNVIVAGNPARVIRER